MPGPSEGRRLDPKEALRVFKEMAEETERLARALYGSRWEDMIDKLEERYDGDPWAVLEHLKKEAQKRGLTPHPGGAGQS